MNRSNLKILFIGGTLKGLELLKFLISREEQVVFAYILEEEESTQSVAADLKAVCQENSIEFKMARKFKKEEKDEVLSHKADVAFVSGWRTVIPSEILEGVPLGCISVHDSLLPKYRGFDPVNWAISNGETETGVTLFKIISGPADSGPVFAQTKIPIGPDDTSGDLFPKIIQESNRLYEVFLNDLRNGSLKWVNQDESQATYMTRRTPQEGVIDWNQPAGSVYNLIRAFAPPHFCARTEVNGTQLLITKAGLPQAMVSNDDLKPGSVISLLYEGMLVACGNGQIVINEVLDENGKKIIISSKTFKPPITLGGSS